MALIGISFLYRVMYRRKKEKRGYAAKYDFQTFEKGHNISASM
jgi:hypothetical protein